MKAFCLRRGLVSIINYQPTALRSTSDILHLGGHVPHEASHRYIC